MTEAGAADWGEGRNLGTIDSGTRKMSRRTHTHREREREREWERNGEKSYKKRERKGTKNSRAESAAGSVNDGTRINGGSVVVVGIVLRRFLL